MMQKHEFSERVLTELQIRDVIERAEVTTPVLAYKVVGNRVELHLLGGPVAYVEADWLIGPEEVLETAVEAADELLDELEEMTYEALYELAKKLKLRGRSVMEESELRAAIRNKGVIGN